MDTSFSPEFFHAIPINKDVLFTLKIEAAKRLVRFEIDNNVSLYPIAGNIEITKQLLFPGEVDGMTKETRKEFRRDARDLIFHSSSRKRNPSNEDILLGLEKLEEEYEKARVQSAVQSVIIAGKKRIK